MAYDEQMAERVRRVLEARPAMDEGGAPERKMFGGIAFMVRGHMCVGITGSDLMVRVGPDAHAEALTLPHARPMDFTGRPMKGFVYVDATGVNDDASLAAWVERGLAFVGTLAPK